MTDRRLVIFDCDGVLVDSEPISIAVLLEIIAEAGIRIDPGDAYRRFLGRSMASIAAAIHEEFGLAITDEHLEAMRLRLYDRFRQALMPIPGLAAMLPALGPARCVASSSQPERIRLSLGVTGLLEFFEPHIYSSTMVANGKPAPDLFLHAANAMGMAPEHCIVVEDSPAGIEAARRAGMRVMAFTGGSHAGPADLRKTVAALDPDIVFDDMRQLPDLIAGLDGQAATS
ncbi:HAD family hydrolase [Chelativorans sp. M5D2P16]|uniref:HAD family hydrolase n=1 Tax=Chelativorans sp. M5D2P16 TaxID=3095678 RepID=UPI002ACAF7BB|nr:HAD family hydrolase [Chelativorans sp. M5D2P16]MDZ5695992.1 HAD family hydrolase [Chelativorans sp. M5D2P16]